MIKWTRPSPSVFCILQVIKNWTVERPENEATFVLCYVELCQLVSVASVHHWTTFRTQGHHQNYSVSIVWLLYEWAIVAVCDKDQKCHASECPPDVILRRSFTRSSTGLAVIEVGTAECKTDKTIAVLNYPSVNSSSSLSLHLLHSHTHHSPDKLSWRIPSSESILKTCWETFAHKCLWSLSDLTQELGSFLYHR